VQIWLCCWKNPAISLLPIKRGNLGELTSQGLKFETEMRGLLEYFQRPMGRVMNLRCGWNFGDGDCQVALGPYTHTGEVVSNSDDRTFEVDLAQADGYFKYGTLEFTSGDNDGFKTEVIDYVGDVVTLIELPPFPVVAADTVTGIRGCDKTLPTCRDSFSNVVRHGGFWWWPRETELTNTPDSKG